MEPEAVIRVADGSGLDQDAIVAIDRACFPEGTVNVTAELERPWSQVWVARAEDAGTEPKAFLLAWLVSDELHVLSVATLPEFRGRGLAQALFRHAIAFAQARGVRSIYLEVRRSNDVAIRLYRYFGFSAVRVRPRYYADNMEDAIEMTLTLDPVTGRPQPGQDEVQV